MTARNRLTLALLLSIAPVGAALAQGGPGGPPPSQPISAAERKAVVDALSTQLTANYVFPEVAASVSAELRRKQASGAYDSAVKTDAFAKLLNKDLRTLGKDGHFQLDYEPRFKPRPADAPQARTAEELEAGRAQFARIGYGIESVQRLPGNVGYLELRGFGPTDIVGPAYTAAMSLLQGTDALILDLRRNGGGEPESVAHLMSHFFAEGDVRHLNDIYDRPKNSTRQYWTNPSINVRYTRPVYVLTSKRTFSGGEEAAYNFQTQKRGTLVGETTGGGANPGDMVTLAHGFVAFIPTGKAINPITGTNWEHVGVKPDIAVPAADAQKTAHAAILRTLAAASKDEGERNYLQDMTAKVESGQLPPPNYAPPK